jgi:hypothetical protein
MGCPMRGVRAVIIFLFVVVPLGTALSPGDTILVGERWF